MPSFIGNERFRADKRQFAGLLFGASICACFFPMATLSSLVGPDGSNPGEISEVPLWMVIASLCVITIGLSGTATGYLAMVHDYDNLNLTKWVLIIVQTAWIAYGTDLTNVGKMASTGMAFGLDQFNGSEGDVWFIGACGILGISSFGFCFLGSLAFFAFSLYAFQAGKPWDRAGGYFKGRLRVYSAMVFIAGLAQLMIGSYTLAYFSKGPISPPIGVAMFIVTYPEISCVVGIIYIINGLWGVVRTFSSPQSSSFQMSIAAQYFCTVVLMILVQIAYQPGGELAAAAPSLACMTMGASVMPAFLDYKARTIPEELNDDYYGNVATAEGELGNLIQHHKAQPEQAIARRQQNEQVEDNYSDEVYAEA